MPLAKVISGTVIGLEPAPVEVEVNIESHGFPAFNIVGLAAKEVDEAKERVRSALKNSGAEFPDRRITVNLAPADLPKKGAAYDLPIALGILIASGQLVADASRALVFGELSLDGGLRHTPGVLPLTLLAAEKGFESVFLPAVNAPEASIVDKVEVIPADSLKSLFHHLSAIKPIEPHPFTSFEALLEEAAEAEFDFRDVRGQEHVKRGLEIAAAGGHNLAMRGPPGAGKTMLARALPSILPRLTVDEALELTKIYSVTGNLPLDQPLVRHRPFRNPHHTTSRIGLIGGGSHPQPGEISLAHRGVLFLDEFPELPRHVLEAMRQPLEDGHVTISRASGSLTFPSKFMLIVASNPCPCGYYQSQDPRKVCTCAPSQVMRYQKRISGPILDRIDIHVNVPDVKVEKLTDGEQLAVESSSSIRGRVQKARDIQLKRYEGTKLTCNGDLTAKHIKKYCMIDEEGKNLLRQAISKMGLSARGFHRVLKVSRTIADLANSEPILPTHLAEALQYRQVEKG